MTTPTTNGNGKQLAVQPQQSELIEKYVEDFDVQRVVALTMAVQQVMRAVMHEGEHYGVIPGTGGKKDAAGKELPPQKSLLQPGADKLCMVFRLRPEYEPVVTVEREDFIAITMRCRLFHITTGQEWGSGLGSSNSREKKYAAQSTKKLCPECSKPTIFRSKNEGEGWFCWKNKGGCGMTFDLKDAGITQQQGSAVTELVWDLHNTMTKMACKRARVAAVLTATGASDMFTQDLEDLEDAAGVGDQGGGEPGARPAAAAGKKGPTAPVGDPNRATPNQIRDLNVALADRKIAAGDRLAWVNEMLPTDIAAVGALTDLRPDHADKLIALAKERS